MVSSAHYLATRCGVEILEEGGNAFDAAVGMSLALAACEPSASGLGGMAHMVAHEAVRGKTFFLSGACIAPREATPAEVAGHDRSRGYPAIAVPTYISVLSHVLSRYGSVSRARVLRTAIGLAEEGYAITPLQSRLVKRFGASLGGAAAELFLDRQGHPLAAGTLLRQPALASTLRRLETEGFEDFYQGDIARRMVMDIGSHGGFVAAGDLLSVTEQEEVEPLRGRFAGWQVNTVPPPGGGVSLVQMLNMQSALPDEAADVDSPKSVIRLAAVISRTRRDRRKWRLKEVPDGEPSERAGDRYAEEAARELLCELESVGETTHLSVMDREGNAVALTQSLERVFGAGVMTPELGFLYNGYMRAFKVENTSHPHFLRPGAVARSNACPAILLESGSPHVVIGSTGSERMASSVFQVLVHLRRGESAFDAVHAPRLHATPEAEVILEKRFPQATIEALERNGFRPKVIGPYSFQAGGLHLVAREGRGFVGVADPRRDGAAAGPGARRAGGRGGT